MSIFFMLLLVESDYIVLCETLAKNLMKIQVKTGGSWTHTN